MAIKNEEYENLMVTFAINSDVIIEGFKNHCNFVDELLNIRKLHSMYLKEAEIFILHPNYETYAKEGIVKGREYMRDLCQDIRNTCSEIGIHVIFTNRESLEFKNRIIAYYKIGNNDVSGLIYFNSEKIKIIKENINNLNLE